MKTVTLACVAYAFFASAALAQVPADKILGKWKATTTGFCGESVVVITKVEANGVVRGTYDCVLQRITMDLGEKMEFRRSMQATLKGNALSIVGSNSSVDVVLEGDKLVGTAKAAQATNPITFTKQ